MWQELAVEDSLFIQCVFYYASPSLQLYLPTQLKIFFFT